MNTHPTSQRALPPLKWAGGKQRLLAQLAPFLPPGRRLIEPFLGAGSVFLAQHYPTYLLNDANRGLMAFWEALKAQPDSFIKDAQSFFVTGNHSKEAYMRVRADYNSTAHPYERAIRLPYLNRFGFNGLFRVNAAGQFNVPYGNPAKLPRFPTERCEAAAQVLQRATLLSKDFATVMELAGPGDVVYCDGPYLESRNGSSFTAYTSAGFNRLDHLRLVQAARAAVSRGAWVAISNHETAETRALYAGFKIHSLEVRRSVSASTSARTHVTELLAVLGER